VKIYEKGRRNKMSEILIRDVEGYETSRDYELLFSLAKQQSIICILDYCIFMDGSVCRDVCQTISDGHEVQVCERGTCFISQRDIESFKKACIHVNLEFIVPMRKAGQGK
jgi:hypothetical protein